MLTKSINQPTAKTTFSLSKRNNIIMNSSNQEIESIPPTSMTIVEPIIMEASPDTAGPMVNPHHTKRQVRGAAAAGGIAGLLIGGPLLAAVGAGVGVYAVKGGGKGRFGTMARKCGDATADAGVSIKRTARKITRSKPDSGSCSTTPTVARDVEEAAAPTASPLAPTRMMC
jgi:hypothetical protein